MKYSVSLKEWSGTAYVTNKLEIRANAMRLSGNFFVFSGEVSVKDKDKTVKEFWLRDTCDVIIVEDTEENDNDFQKDNG